ncbi:MAG: hypothetical protein MUC87_11715 [Bacteroidia bacterium]|nr:hypothetical protein [Bacteroidia bacterium]
MKQLTASDRLRAIDVLEAAFEENRAICTFVKDYGRKKALRKIISYSVNFALRRKGVFASDDFNSILLCYPHHAACHVLPDMLAKCKLILTALSLRRIFKILRHYRYIQSIRPNKGKYLYIWYWGTLVKGNNIAENRNMISTIFDMARENEMDIYAETTIRKNKNVYERYGFEVYHEWQNEELNIKVWFMRKPYIPQYARAG